MGTNIILFTEVRKVENYRFANWNICKFYLFKSGIGFKAYPYIYGGRSTAKLRVIVSHSVFCLETIHKDCLHVCRISRVCIFGILQHKTTTLKHIIRLLQHIAVLLSLLTQLSQHIDTCLFAYNSGLQDGYKEFGSVNCSAWPRLDYSISRSLNSLSNYPPH